MAISNAPCGCPQKTHNNSPMAQRFLGQNPSDHIDLLGDQHKVGG
jgi:hypothetical protein